MMRRRHLWISAAIIAVVILITFALSVPHTRDVGQKQPAPELPGTPSVTLQDSYKKGEHTLSGTIVTPNACTAVAAGATLEGDASSTQAIRLDLSLSSEPGICLELPTAQEYNATVTAPAGVPITVTVDGAVATTTP